MNVLATSLDHSRIPVFMYISREFDPNKSARLSLFLHGRGYAREIGSSDSMLEHLNIGEVLKASPQLVILAPQDIFYHLDSQSIGQDYWLGVNRRDWLQFLGSEFPVLTKEIQKQFKIEGQLDTVIGISMGAHGALSVAEHFPKIYQNVAALSPVFRPVKSEIPLNDQDVFRPDDHEYMSLNNIGTQLLERKYQLPKNVFITISQGDFALDREKFPEAHRCWDQLVELRSEKSFVEINEDIRGHSAAFWIDQLPLALDFLNLPQ